MNRPRFMPMSVEDERPRLRSMSGVRVVQGGDGASERRLGFPVADSAMAAKAEQVG